MRSRWPSRERREILMSETPPTLRLLHLEDDAADAEYFAHLLRAGGLACEITSVATQPEFEQALRSAPADLILCDNSLPGYSGEEALVLAHRLRPEVPFIFLSGSIGEEAAIETLKNGATDYVLKSRTSRLIPAVTRALRERRDREERLRAEAALRHSEERYALAARGANDGLWDYDLRAGKVFFSPRWKSMLGYAEDEVGSDPKEWFERIHPEDAEMVNLQWDRHLAGKTAQWQCEHRLRAKSGSYLWVLGRGMAIRAVTGEPTRVAGSISDIGDRKRAEEQLLYDAFHDAVTGLFNRNLFLNRLQRLLWVGKRRGVPRFSVLLLGLDRFDAVHDGLGRQAADQMLIETARRIERKMRPGDTLARIGHDVFAVLMEENAVPGEVVHLIQNIRGLFQEALRPEGREVFVTLSAGVVHDVDRQASAEEILRDGGLALGKAKARKASGFAVFNEEMHAQALALLDLETDLRHALERHEFRVHYQPVISLASGTLSGFEALVRWQHPQRGLVPPMEFIPFAEQSHFINAIGKTVLDSACAQLRAWQDSHPGREDLTVSVNVSGKQFRQPDLFRQIVTVLEETGLNPKCLKLEITETAIMEDPEAAARLLIELRNAGIGLQIDDFGTGYSSLGYLHRFPTQALKIDQSFVSKIGRQGENAEIAATIISIAHHLGMQVIAEGIEAPYHLRALKNIGCEYGQGFLFSRPVETDQAEKLIAAQPFAV